MEQRTPRQNRAMHKYFDLLSEKLNEGGLDMRVVMKPDVDLPWTPENVKNLLWRPIQEAYLKKHSTTELETGEINEIYEILTRHLGEKFGIFVDFPHIEDEDETGLDKTSQNDTR